MVEVHYTHKRIEGSHRDDFPTAIARVYEARDSSRIHRKARVLLTCGTQYNVGGDESSRSDSALSARPFARERLGNLVQRRSSFRILPSERHAVSGVAVWSCNACG